MSVYRHPFPLFPALDRRHVAVEVCRDFLPRTQAVSGCSDGWQCAWRLFVHGVLCSRILDPLPSEALQNTAFGGKSGNLPQIRDLPLAGTAKVSECVCRRPAKGGQERQEENNEEDA